VRIDQLRLNCPEAVTVTSSADSGPGSLRSALSAVCVGGTVQFAPELAGQSIGLVSGPLTLAKNVTIDGTGAPGLKLSGGGSNRVVIVNAGTTATIRSLILADGFGWQLAGGVLNNGSLTLDRVLLTNNVMQTDAGDFWQGGGGIYSGSGATLNLIDSTVSGNYARWSGGGVYAFFNTTTTITRSTISGNTSGDVGGAIRSLGNMTITNSTISGNISTGWHGGAIFHTDGAMVILNSTITGNTAPDWGGATIFVGSFNQAVPSFVMTNSIVTGNRNYACDHWTGAMNFSSGGGNLVQDDTCDPVATDQVGADAKLGPLADNGGPTLTHTLLPGSAAIDKAVASACPAVDQRGVTRPQGAGCDVGAVEVE
jgi:predicted outer membrane repeat protein